MKLYKSSEQYKMLEALCHEKFIEFYEQMDVNDIVPIYRLQYKGPAFESYKWAVALEDFLIKNEEKYVGGLK